MIIRTSHLRLAVIALAAAVLYNLWYFVLRPGPRPAERAAPDQPLISIPAEPARFPASADPAAIPAPPPVDMVAPPTWHRDPFLFGDETRSVAPAGDLASAAPEPAVTSILFSQDRRLAIVGGRIVGVGESVGGYRVSDIEQAAVMFVTPAGTRIRVSVHGAAPEGLVR